MPWGWMMGSVKIYFLFADRALKYLDKHGDYFHQAEKSRVV